MTYQYLEKKMGLRGYLLLGDGLWEYLVSELDISLKCVFSEHDLHGARG